ERPASTDGPNPQKHEGRRYPSRMRMSQLFARTLRDAPADAEAASHKLLVRAAMVRQLMSGVYTFLPLGLRVLRKIERVIREEMDVSGAQEDRKSTRLNSSHLGISYA